MDSPQNKNKSIVSVKLENNSSVIVDDKKVQKLSTGSPIEVVPEEIIFKDIQINQTYEITVFVRNLTKTARRIRVFQPHTSKFRADYDMQGAIAAGLAMKLVITFETSILEEFHDSIKIVSDGGSSLEVPLHAYPPQAAIIFEPFINLGFVRVGKEKIEEIFFKNEGKAPGKVDLRFEKLQDLKIEPTSFTIQSNQEYAVKLNYKPREAGIFRGLIEVIAEGNPIQKTIDINATSIEFTRFLIDENGSQTNQFDFGVTYYGQLKLLETYLVNNTPKQQKFKVSIKKGHHYQAEDISNLQTPNELGLEQTERIMDCFPSEGIIESYSQMPLKFKCQSKVNEKQLIWTRQFALNNEDLKADLDDFHYSAIFEFAADQTDPLIVHLQAKCICPTIKFPPQNVIQFGTCAANLEKQVLFQVTNKNKELPVTITFPTIPFFSVSPVTYNLQPDTFAGFWVNFKPKQTGSFQSTLNVELLNGVYKIPIKLCGTSTIFGDKQSIRRGPECVPEDFERAKKALIKKQEEPKKLTQSLDGSISKLDSSIINNNKSMYNEYLRTSRLQRLSKEKDKKVQQKFKQLKERLKELGFENTDSKKLLEGSNAQDQEEVDSGQAPVDYEFEVGMMEQGLQEPELNLPEAKDTLFVTKPIDKYEPLRPEKEVDGKVLKNFNPNPNLLVKKKFPHEPKTHGEIRDTSIELSAEMLQKIQSGPVKIDFGAVYVKSRMVKTFYVRNDLRTAISVRLHTDREELQLSYLKPQMQASKLLQLLSIPSGQIAGFDTVLCSRTLGPVKQNIKYIINEKHIFEFQVSGTIDPVQIDMSKLTLKFTFAEDNTDMETSETIKLTNNGNAPGKFKFLLSDKRVFTTSPEEGEVPSASSIDVKVTYRPTQTQQLSSQVAQPTQQIMAALNRNEDEKLIFRVTDGVDLSLRCFGIVNEPKCFLKQPLIEVREIAVCKLEQRPLTIKNQSRSSAVFQVVQESLPPFVEVVPMKGKIFPEDWKELQVKFQSKEEVSIKGEIVINIRGGRILKIPFTGKTIIPDVFIVEEEFDFGNITTLGNSLPMKLTVTNNSSIPADLVLDLRGDDENPQAPDGIDCLEIKTSEDADESLLHSVHPDEEQQSPQPGEAKLKKGDVDEEVELDAMVDDQSEQSEPVDLEVKQHKMFNLTLQPAKTIYFTIKFCPKEVKQYNFTIPLSLARFGPLATLSRQVLCKGLKPKFLIEPQSIDFKKKVITTPDKCFPTIQEVTLSNPDRRDIRWKADILSLKQDKIFDLEPNEGVVASGQQEKIKVKFNPYGPGLFTSSIPIYILDDPEISATLPYAELSFSGSGAYPRLLFDKKEVILPVVPLNIISRCTFRIINDGYENLNLQYKWGQEIGNFQVELRFPEGKNLGITKSRLKVEVVFHHKKPLSFTTRLEFIDEARVYSINISGTTDNCLLTNYVFLQRKVGEFKIFSEDKKNLQIVEDDSEGDSVSDQKSRPYDKKSRKTVAASVRSGSSKSSAALGYSPLKQEQIDESCDYIMRWLNYHVLSNAISNFPDSVIEHNGSEIFELVAFLTGKSNPPYKVVIEVNAKRVDRCQLLFKQYDEMIRSLKIEGALLNHIRPEYLLSYPDYLGWLKVQPKERFEYVPENLLRLSLSKYNYIQNDAWITLFYQILKIYYLGRISAKGLKQVAGVPAEKQVVPDYYLDGSNLVSAPEGVVLYWFEMCYENAHPLQKRRLTFGSIQDGLPIAAAIQTYIGVQSTRFMQGLRVSCQTEDDYKNNAEKVLQALNDCGLQSHVTMNDLYRPQQREMLLFLTQLFYALPHYIPKRDPIIFQCVLGEEIIKSIDLTNPTPKPISYWVKYEGHQDFQLDGEDSIKIDPKQTFKYRIKFTSRITMPVQGRIIFTNKKETNVQAAALVFDLISQITGRKSEKQWNVTTALYDQTEFTITITNKFTFADQAEFSIAILHKKLDQKQSKKKIKQEKDQTPNQLPQTDTQKALPTPDAPKDPQPLNDEEFPAFFCRLERVKIKKGKSVELPITFLPLTLEPHTCQVIFTDPTVGEFQHEIVGTVELPNIGDIKPDKPFYVDTPTIIPTTISFNNEQMLKARRAVETFVLDKNKDKFLKGDRSVNLQPGKLQFPGGISEMIQLECELYPQTQYLTVPGVIVLQDPNRLTKKTNLSQNKKDVSFDSKPDQFESNVNRLQISYAFKNPVKDFNVLLTLRNSSKTDIRRLRLWATVLPKVVKSTLEFRVPARQAVIQDIPIVNNTEREWAIKVTFVTENMKNATLFSVQSLKDFIVKKKSTGQFPVTFTPTWVQDAEAKLILSNPITNDVFEYELKGFGEEPVAEEHIILNCSARKATRRDIELKNPYPDKSITYKVDTDLINASGKGELSIPPGKKSVYQLLVTPVLSGQYTGSITFTDDFGHYFWYTVFLNTEAPKASENYDLSSMIRQVTVFQVALSNPLDKPVIYEAVISGDGLQGENTFVVAPNEVFKYDLYFMPLKVGKWKGSVAFINEQLGEVWYELNLQADEQPATRLALLKASLGKTEEQVVFLENPSEQSVLLTTRVTNPTNFDVLPENITIPAYDQVRVSLRYMPSSLDVIEHSDIIFSSAIGKWHYLIFGQGLPPTKFATMTVSVGLNKDYSSVVHFKNPFKEPINVMISMDKEGHNVSVFKLLQAKKQKESDKILVPGMNVVQIPFSFVPREITSYYCEIVVMMNEKIQWRYPIKGVTESVNNQALFNFKCKCRDKWEDEFKVNLTGIVQSLGENDKFDFEISGVPNDLASMLQRCFQVKCTKNSIDTTNDSLQYNVRFTPMKPFKASLDFIILRQSGGRWKFKIQLEATDPEEDDVIIISSALNRTASVSFKLTNKIKGYAKFIAAFSPESDAEFSILPKSGDLEPYGREGNTFIVSFTPVEYGKIRRGKLIIQTDDMYWSYQVRGILPKYQRPLANKSMIDHQLDPRISESIANQAPKNFLVENIKKARQFSPIVRKPSPMTRGIFPTLNDSQFHQKHQ